MQHRAAYGRLDDAFRIDQFGRDKMPNTKAPRATIAAKAEKKAATLGWEILMMAFVDGDGAQAPGAVTLSQTGADVLVVHFFNAEDGGFHSGEYVQPDEPEAVMRAHKKFTDRATRYQRHMVAAKYTR